MNLFPPLLFDISCLLRSGNKERLVFWSWFSIKTFAEYLHSVSYFIKNKARKEIRISWSNFIHFTPRWQEWQIRKKVATSKNAPVMIYGGRRFSSSSSSSSSFSCLHSAKKEKKFGNYLQLARFPEKTSGKNTLGFPHFRVKKRHVGNWFCVIYVPVCV